MVTRRSPRTRRSSPRRWHRWVATGIGCVLLLIPSGWDASAEKLGSKVPEAQPGAPAFPPAVRTALSQALAGRSSGYEPRTRHRRTDGSPLYSNRLLLEASPYLQQHAHNPVNWYPWGEEAFEAARHLDRPVLVSIGYSTCHWCHVMEEESFDDVETARYLNEHFICVKVDREARPDIDSVYMSAAHAIMGSGGWPLNVWVTPERKPFFAGTYFPRKERPGRKSFRDVLEMLHEVYSHDRGRVHAAASRLTEAVRAGLTGASARQSLLPDPAVLERAKAAYLGSVDRVWGGIGQRNKFPSRFPIRFLLRYHRRTGDQEVLDLVTLSLEKMAAGGMYDQLGGGFHRYSTDMRWLVPHFEKMLYGNALLALAYLEGWQVTKRSDFAGVTRETLDYVLRELTSPEGGFYSATDADSPDESGEQVEGWFFTWTPAEIDAALDPAAARVAKAYWGITDHGPVEGRSVLHVSRDIETVASELALEPQVFRKKLQEARVQLLKARSHRVRPLRDEKVVVAWNGLTISAMARAGFSLDEPRWVRAAERAAQLILGRMKPDGRLRRVYKDGRAAGPAFLDDYAFLIGGLLDLYEASPDSRWLREALALQETLDLHYADEAGGGYFRSADDQERLIAREKPSSDGAIPSGNSVAAANLLRLYAITTDDHHLERAALLFSAFAETLSRQPTAVPQMLSAVDWYLDTAKEIVIAASSDAEALAAMLAPLRATHLPNRVIALISPGESADQAQLVPWVEGKGAKQGRVTAYVCENRVCDLPTTDPLIFARQIRKVKPLRP